MIYHDSYEKMSFWFINSVSVLSIAILPPIDSYSPLSIAILLFCYSIDSNSVLSILHFIDYLLRQVPRQPVARVLSHHQRLLLLRQLLGSPPDKFSLAVFNLLNFYCKKKNLAGSSSIFLFLSAKPQIFASSSNFKSDSRPDLLVWLSSNLFSFFSILILLPSAPALSMSTGIRPKNSETDLPDNRGYIIIMLSCCHLEP